MKSASEMWSCLPHPLRRPRSKSFLACWLRRTRVKAIRCKMMGRSTSPMLGVSCLLGLTIEAAEAELFQRLVENQIDPTFSLEIAEFNSRRVSIGGAVAQPTVLPVTLTPLYLEEAISAAGGITVEDQDFASVRLYRDGTLYQIPLNELYSSTGLLRTRLVDGDAVFVDTEYELGQAASYFEQQIALTNARRASRDTALNQLNTEVNLRRAELDEARTIYRDRIELGADNNDYVYLVGEVRRQSDLPCLSSVARIWPTLCWQTAKASHLILAMSRRSMSFEAQTIRVNSARSQRGIWMRATQRTMRL